MGNRHGGSSNSNHLTSAVVSDTGGAAIHIRKSVMRLFCETLRAVFLGERDQHLQDSLVMGAHTNELGSSVSTVSTMDSATAGNERHERLRRLSSQSRGVVGAGLGAVWHAGLGTPPPDIYTAGAAGPLQLPFVQQWLEIYDYASDARFRGFVATNSYGQRTLFIFFERNIVGKDLKQALMALIELASTPALPPCEHMVVCFDREEGETPVTKALLRDLGWVGFELTTLKGWAEGFELVSGKWLFVGMEV